MEESAIIRTSVNHYSRQRTIKMHTEQPVLCEEHLAKNVPAGTWGSCWCELTGVLPGPREAVPHLYL